MNKDFSYIFGEIDLTENKFVILFVFFSDIKIDVKQKNDIAEKTHFLNGKKYTTQKLILNYENCEIYINEKVIKIPKTSKFNYNFLNCDCQFVLDCGLRNQIKKGMDSINFHLGDQLYCDLLFLKMSNSEITKEDMRKIIYEEYRKAFFGKKAEILQNSFNIMLGDDHEISDESIRGKMSTEKSQIFMDIFNEIQMSLRIDSKKNISIFPDINFILVDNSEILSSIDYVKNLEKILGDIIYENKKYYILSPRNLLNCKNHPVYNFIYKSEDVILNYNSFYEFLFKVQKEKNVEFTILCGDEHSSAFFEIINEGKKIDFYFVGPLNSVVDPPCENKFLLNGNHSVEKKYHIYDHAFMSKHIDENLHHNFNDTGCCFSALTTVEYICKFFCAKYFNVV